MPLTRRALPTARTTLSGRDVAVAFAALPVAALVIAGAAALAAVRSRLRRRAARAIAGTRTTTPAFGGDRHLRRLRGRRRWLALAVGAIELDAASCAAILARLRDRLRVGLLDDLRHLHPAREARGAGRRRRRRARERDLRRDRSATTSLAVGARARSGSSGITNAFNLLDNMDGLAATPRRRRRRGASRSTAAVGEPERRRACSSPPRSRWRCLGFLPFNLRPRGPALVFMGDSGSQVLGFVLAALGLMASATRWPGRRSRLVLPLLVLAVPILDTTLVTVLRARSRAARSTQGGRDHTSHRLVYCGLSERRAVAAARRGLRRARRHEPRVRRARQRPDHRGRRARHVRAARRSSRASWPTSSEDARPRTAPAARAATLVRRSRAAGRGGRRLRARHAPSFYAAYLLIVEGKGTREPAARLHRRAADRCSPRATSRFVAFGLYRRVWRYAGGARRCSSIAVAVRLGRSPWRSSR